MDIVFLLVVHNFYTLPHPRQKSGDSVTLAFVAPMQLRCLICHTEINACYIFLVMEEDWDWRGVLLQ